MRIQKFNVGLKPFEVIVPVWLEDSSTEAGKTGLAYNTAGLTITFGQQFGGATSFIVEDIADLTTYAEPSSSTHCQFKEYDASNCPGCYFVYLPLGPFQFEGATTFSTFGSQGLSRWPCSSASPNRPATSTAAFRRLGLGLIL